MFYISSKLVLNIFQIAILVILKFLFFLSHMIIHNYADEFEYGIIWNSCLSIDESKRIENNLKC
jgi:hypothetical protein